MDDVISSAANPLVKRVRLLADSKSRRREGAFVVDGIQPVWQAVEAGADIERLIVAPDLLASPGAVRMVREQEARGTPVTRVTGELFTRMSEREGPSGLAAIVRGRLAGLDSLAVGAGSFFVALHDVGNPGNLGTILRTADAVGAAGVLVLGRTTDPFAPASVKASMGALFHVPIGQGTVEEFFDWTAGHAVTVVTTSARAEDDLWSAPCPLPLALLLGSEGDGLPDDVFARGDVRVRIPMVGAAESLNLAVAAGVLLYELRRRSTVAP